MKKMEDLPRNHEGQHGAWQDGRYFTQGQASEMHVCPGRYTDWNYAVGVVKLDDGTFLAWNGLPDRNEARTPTAWSGKRWGGFFTYSRRYASRDEAFRSNIAYCLWIARKQWRLPRAGFYQGEKISDERYRQIVEWAFSLTKKRAPGLYIPEPPPPPIVKDVPDRHGQLGFAL